MKKLLCSLALTSIAYAADATPPISAWFTGPLLCPSYSVVTGGAYDIEPYLFVNLVTGNYDNHWDAHSQDTFIQTYFYILTQIGLTDYMDVSLSPQFFYQSQSNYTAANIGDLPLELDFALLTEHLETWKPGIRLALRANAPIAPYRKLSPGNPTVEAIGSGSWKPALALTIGKQFHLGGYRFIAFRAFFNGQFRNKVSVRGFHAYGGGYNTRGRVTLNAQYTGIASFEYSFTRHWVFALDTQWQHNNRITFKGRPGTAKDGSVANNTSPSSDQFSIAPGFEYNFNANVGFIGGVWWTLLGRNAQRFVTPTFALNISY